MLRLACSGQGQAEQLSSCNAQVSVSSSQQKLRGLRALGKQSISCPNEARKRGCSCACASRGSFIWLRSLSRGASAGEGGLLKTGEWGLSNKWSTVNLSFSLVDLKLVFSSGKHLYLLKVGFMGTAIERTLVQEHPRNIYLLDVDWKRNLIYWTSAEGHLFYSAGYSGAKQKIWTERTGELGCLFWICPLFSGTKIKKDQKTPTCSWSEPNLMPNRGF